MLSMLRFAPWLQPMVHYPLSTVRTCTVFALSTVYGRSAVALVRVSGERAAAAIESMTTQRSLPPPHRAVLREIRHPVTSRLLDRALVLWMPSPRSYTGEDSVELHLHGSLAVINSVLEALSVLPGYRLAEKGEFTRRAFANGKMDLAEVEALSDLINADTEMQQEQALRQGQLSILYNKWRQLLVEARARLEAYLDFSEEGYEQFDDIRSEVESHIRAIQREMKALVADPMRGELVRSGFRLAILGRPNAGKSTSMNALAKRRVSIVANVPGTTRDVTNAELNLGGFPVMVLDTAGLRTPNDAIEQVGVALAVETAFSADMALLVIDVFDVLNNLESVDYCTLKKSDIYSAQVMESIPSQCVNELCLNKNLFDLNKYVRKYLRKPNETTNETISLLEATWYKEYYFVICISKIDLLDLDQIAILKNVVFKYGNSYSLSAFEGCKKNSHSESSSQTIRQSATENLTDNVNVDDRVEVVPVSFARAERVDDMKEALSNVCSRMVFSGNTGNELPVFTNARHKILIDAAIRELSYVTGEVEDIESVRNSDDNLILEDENLLSREDRLVEAAFYLRRATRCLGEIVGDVTSEDVLDQIFKDFCIGK